MRIFCGRCFWSLWVSSSSVWPSRFCGSPLRRNASVPRDWKGRRCYSLEEMQVRPAAVDSTFITCLRMLMSPPDGWPTHCSDETDDKYICTVKGWIFCLFHYKPRRTKVIGATPKARNLAEVNCHTKFQSVCVWDWVAVISAKNHKRQRRKHQFRNRQTRKVTNTNFCSLRKVCNTNLT